MSDDVVLRTRRSTADDYDALWDLHVASMRPSVEATWGWDDAFQVDHFRERFRPGDRDVVELHGAAVGVFALTAGPDETFVNLIEVHPDHQGRGLGTSLLRLVTRDAYRRGVPIALNVLKANPRARSLYERLGFEVTEEDEVRYRMVRRASSQGSAADQ